MASAALDANVAIGLAAGGVFHHLKELFSPITLPAEVAHEVIRRGAGRAGVVELNGALVRWVHEVTPEHAHLISFSSVRDLADRKLLAVAAAAKVDFVLSADRVVAREATSVGITSLTAPEVVLLMKQAGLVLAAKPVLDRMRQQGFGIDAQAYARALRAAGETP